QPALELLQRFCRVHRDDAEAHHLLGVSYEAMGQTDRALAAYDVAISLDPDDSLVRTSLENALAAREGVRGPALLPARSTHAAAPAATADMRMDVEADESSDELPPKRPPRALSTAATGQEPNRLDSKIAGEAAEAGSSTNGPRIEVLAVPIEKP